MSKERHDAHDNYVSVYFHVWISCRVLDSGGASEQGEQSWRRLKLRDTAA